MIIFSFIVKTCDEHFYITYNISLQYVCNDWIEFYDKKKNYVTISFNMGICTVSNFPLFSLQLLLHALEDS
jgi:hypothetical protein